MADEEMLSKTGLELPGPKRALLLFGRAFLLRCPNCGGRPVLRNWLKLHERCPVCGIRLERGEHDYFTGSILVNFVMSGILFLGVLVVTVAVTWPDVPWDTLQYLLPLLILVAPIVLFPFAKLVWLAFDLMLRPASAEELDWHRETRETWSSEDQGPRR